MQFNYKQLLQMLIVSIDLCASTVSEWAYRIAQLAPPGCQNVSELMDQDGNEPAKRVDKCTWRSCFSSLLNVNGEQTSWSQQEVSAYRPLLYQQQLENSAARAPWLW